MLEIKTHSKNSICYYQIVIVVELTRFIIFIYRTFPKIEPLHADRCPFYTK